MVVLTVGMTEVVSILVRKHNGGLITPALFQQALSDLRTEIGTKTPIRLVDVTGTLAEDAYPFDEKYSINSTDAILLRSALDLATVLRTAGDDLLLVASDQRLLKAARAERLSAFDPEVQSVGDLDAILGP
jgi:predicted nucleic acid-binding protein